jgi:nucleoside-diphosphate-sugar epimerase
VNLVTGATGFIGRHLAMRLVREGFPLRVLCRPGSEANLPAEVTGHAEIARGDLRDRDSLFAAARGATRVFHCAGLVADWGPSAGFAAANVEGTRALLDAAIAADVARFVHLSSIAAFGTPSPPYFDDASPYGDSADDYSRTKVEGEKAVFEAHCARGLAATVLRPAVVYGPGGAWLEKPLAMIEQGRMFLLGGGEGTCHPCYVENLVDAMLLAGNHPGAVGEGFIVADGEPITFREYFDALASIAGKPPVARSIPLFAARAMATTLEAAARVRKSDRRPLLTHTAIAMVTTKSRLSTEKIRRLLGFRPRWSFRSAITDLRAWYPTRKIRGQYT